MFIFFIAEEGSLRYFIKVFELFYMLRLSHTWATINSNLLNGNEKKLNGPYKIASSILSNTREFLLTMQLKPQLLWHFSFRPTIK